MRTNEAEAHASAASTGEGGGTCRDRARVARQVKDKRVLKPIRRYLEAELMEGGLVSPVDEGTPQGGPLSPLLSNILLADLDRELEKRGHRFCR